MRRSTTGEDHPAGPLMASADTVRDLRARSGALTEDAREQLRLWLDEHGLLIAGRLPSAVAQITDDAAASWEAEIDRLEALAGGPVIDAEFIDEPAAPVTPPAPVGPQETISEAILVPEHDPPSETPSEAPAPSKAALARSKAIGQRASALGLTDDARHDLIATVTGGRVASAKLLTPVEFAAVLAELDRRDPKVTS